MVDRENEREIGMTTEQRFQRLTDHLRQEIEGAMIDDRLNNSEALWAAFFGLEREIMNAIPEGQKEVTRAQAERILREIGAPA